MPDEGRPRHACDPQRPGDVILAVARDDGLGRELLYRGRELGMPGLELVEEVERLDDVSEQFGAGEGEVGLRPDGDLHLSLLRVPEGDEQAAAASLVRLRLTLALEYERAGEAPRVIAQPNRYLDFDAAGGAVELTHHHDRYLEALGLAQPRARLVDGHVPVRVIDSGCNRLPRVTRCVNIFDRSADVSDQLGHGSIITAIVDDCTHGHASFELFKVADATRKPTEWEVLLALSLGPMPPIVNLSLSLGFGRVACRTCGRQPVGARTGVFEERLRELEEAGVIVVAAAGNRSEEELLYPSRFSSVVSVMAWAGHPPRLAPYSNWGTADQSRSRHPNVFVCPGGDGATGERLVAGGAGVPGDGTSYATAYMTGLLAATWAQTSGCTSGCDVCRRVVLDEIRRAADPRAFDPLVLGHGLALMPGAARAI